MRGDPFEWQVEPPGSAVSIGVYDGVHLGHQEVLRDLHEWAGDRLETVVLTFDRHPRSVVVPDPPVKLLTSEEQRLELFASLGIHTVGLLPFGQIRTLDPAKFIQEVLSESLRARLVVVGADFRFGRDRAGDAEYLRAAGSRLGFEVRTVPLVEDAAHEVYSSTVIRTNILNGEVAAATTALGRPFELRGVVVEGDGRGSQLGIPTANVRVSPDMAIPARGVYAVQVRVGGELHDGVANIGVRPTFGGDREVLEAHILDFEGDLYGTEIGVLFVDKVREEKAFSGVDDLVDQIHRDIGNVKAVLGNE